MDESTSKRCSTCKETKPLDGFQRNVRMRDGLQNECKTCRAERQRAYRAANPDKIRGWGREGMRRRREADPDAHREYMREWRTANAELVRLTRKAWETANYERHREAARAANLRWKRANPDRVKAEYLKRRAMKAAADVGDVDLEALWESQGGLCGLCGEPIDRTLAWPDPMSASIDHIVPLALNGAHSQDNLQWAHLIENIRKGARLQH